MPTGYVIDSARALVLSRAWGTLDDSDLIAHVEALAADPLFTPSLSQLIDFSDLVAMTISAATVREMAARNPFGRGARRALVTKSDLQYGFARMYDIERGDSKDELAVFRDLDLALEWLGVADAKQELVARLRGAPPILKSSSPPQPPTRS